MKKILVTGGTGFVGHYVCRALNRNGWSVRIISRNPNLIKPDHEIEVFSGTISNLESMTQAARGCDAVVHLVGIIEENPRRGATFDAVHVIGTRNVVDAAKAVEIETFVHMSANGAAQDGRTAYQRTKWKAEQIVKAAGFQHATIFRPSLIFGKPISGTVEFATRIRDTLIKPFPIWPVPGRGDYRLQPIAVENVADAFADAVMDSKHAGQLYCIGGNASFTYLEILDTIAEASGRKIRPKLFQPIWGVRPVVSLLAPTGLLPITPAQLELLIGGNTCDSDNFQNAFKYELTPFDVESLSYLRE